MNITVNEVMYAVLTICLPFLVRTVCQYFSAKYRDTVYNDAVQAVVDAVGAVNQTYTNTLKEQGKFDAAAQEVARSRAVEIALATMSDAAVKYCNKLCGSAEKFILDKLESVIDANKRGVG